jgi:YD repeat-containing protein
MLNQFTQLSMTRSSTTQTRTFVYDPTTRRLTSATHPESGTVSYTYNSDGTVATRIDARNQKTAYVYDSYKRVTQIQHYPVSTGPEDTCQRQTFSYDTNPYKSDYPQNAWGRLTAVTWQSAGCTKSFYEMYSYTPVGLVMKKRLGLSTADCGYMEATFGYKWGGNVNRSELSSRE